MTDRSTRCTIVGGIAERELLAEPGPPLVVVDRALDLGPDLAELALGLQPPPFDAGERVAADHLVRVGARVHDAASIASTGSSCAGAAAPPRTAPASDARRHA